MDVTWTVYFQDMSKRPLNRGLIKEELLGMLKFKPQHFCFAFPEIRSALGPANTITRKVAGIQLPLP